MNDLNKLKFNNASFGLASRPISKRKIRFTVHDLDGKCNLGCKDNINNNIRILHGQPAKSMQDWNHYEKILQPAKAVG